MKNRNFKYWQKIRENIGENVENQEKGCGDKNSSSNQNAHIEVTVPRHLTRKQGGEERREFQKKQQCHFFARLLLT